MTFRVLMVNTGINPAPWIGGVENHTYHLAKSLAEIGNQVDYVTDLTGEAIFNKNVKIHRINSPRFKYPVGFPYWVVVNFIGSCLCFRATLRTLILNRYDYDLIHAHGYLSSFGISKVFGNLPLVYTMHNSTPLYTSESPYEQYFRKVAFHCVDLKVLKKANWIITVSRKLRDDIVRFWGIPKDKVTSIHNGVDTHRFQPNASLNSPLRKYQINGRYFLFVGQLRRSKGVDYILKAFNHVRDLDISCVIVGDGPMRRYLMKLTKDLKLSERVIFTGPVGFKDLPSIYSSADFFVLPTLAEGGPPQVILEAMASGLPVISTNVSGIPELVHHKYNGLIIPPRNLTALEKWITCLAEDSNLRKRMGINARQTALQDFSWSSVAKRTQEVYEKVVG